MQRMIAVTNRTDNLLASTGCTNPIDQQPVARSATLRSKKYLPSSLDHLVGPCQHRWRDRQAERLGSLHVDDQLELGRLLDRHVACLAALEDAIDENRRVTSSL